MLKNSKLQCPIFLRFSQIFGVRWHPLHPQLIHHWIEAKQLETCLCFRFAKFVNSHWIHIHHKRFISDGWSSVDGANTSQGFLWFGNLRPSCHSTLENNLLVVCYCIRPNCTPGISDVLLHSGKSCASLIFFPFSHLAKLNFNPVAFFDIVVRNHRQTTNRPSFPHRTKFFHRDSS